MEITKQVFNWFCLIFIQSNRLKITIETLYNRILKVTAIKLINIKSLYQVLCLIYRISANRGWFGDFIIYISDFLRIR